MPLEKVITIENPHGLHARPASQFVQAAARFVSEVSIEKDGEKIDGRSIMGILSLGLEFGSKIVLTVDGDDQEEALVELEKILLNHE